MKWSPLTDLHLLCNAEILGIYHLPSPQFMAAGSSDHHQTMVGHLSNKALKTNQITISNSLKGPENISKFGTHFFLYWYILCSKCMFIMKMSEIWKFLEEINSLKIFLKWLIYWNFGEFLLIWIQINVQGYNSDLFNYRIWNLDNTGCGCI